MPSLAGKGGRQGPAVSLWTGDTQAPSARLTQPLPPAHSPAWRASEGPSWVGVLSACPHPASGARGTMTAVVLLRGPGSRLLCASPSRACRSLALCPNLSLCGQPSFQPALGFLSSQVHSPLCMLPRIALPGRRLGIRKPSGCGRITRSGTSGAWSALAKAHGHTCPVPVTQKEAGTSA